MPTLTIDNRTITVPEGANVLEAAKELGIVIPHFCYHEALGAVGACRLCAMTFVEGPVKGVQMACMVKAADDMVVSTLDPLAEELRRHVIEWLMLNHPHDCPVCDEGGECQLQDLTIAGGHAIRRYRGKKQTWRNQDLGPYVEQEMNRCIQCYRCVRTYQDYCGGTDFGVMGSRDRLFFGRFEEGPLESPFSGNLVDVCPTGVFTDKTFRFKSRCWDLEEAPSICIHCSLGCAVIPGARYRELQRVRAGINREVNGFFICDRGRFDRGHANHPERPRTPRLDGREVTWNEALENLQARLDAIVTAHGPQAVAFLGSSRASLEANWLLSRWASRIGSPLCTFDVDSARDRAARAVAAGLGDRARSLREIRQSDLVLLVGADPLSEGPLLALAVRQAVRSGGFAAVLAPRPGNLPFAAAHLPLRSEQLIVALGALQSGDWSEFSREEAMFLEGLAARFRQAKAPVLVGGGNLPDAQGVAALLQAAASRPDCGAMLLLSGPNSYGAALLAGDGPDFDRLLAGMHAGTIKALVCLEADPWAESPHGDRSLAALEKLELLVALTSLPARSVRAADLLLPTTVTAEAAGTYINNEGRMLAFARVFAPGLSIAVTGGGRHPPRTFGQETPGGAPRPAWRILAELLGDEPSLPAVRAALEGSDGRFAGLANLDPQGPGVRVTGIRPEGASRKGEDR